MSKKRFVLALSLLPFLFAASAGRAVAEEMEASWAEEVGALGERIASLASRGGRLLVAGQSEFTGAPDFLHSFVAARDARSGEPDWERPLEGEFRYLRVAAQGGRVYAITTGDRESVDQEATVVALRASDGEILWEDHIPRAEIHGTRFFVLPGARRTVAIAALDLDPPEGSNVRSVGAQIRVYDASGERQWELTLGGEHPDYDFSVRAAAIKGRLLWIAGSVEGDYIVRCYDLLDGEVEWEDRFTVPDTFGTLDTEWLTESADLLAVRGRTLVVAGSTLSQAVPHNGDPVVRAYEARSGAVLWTHTTSEDQKEEFPREIVLSGDKAIVAWLRNGSVWSGRLDAFDLRTGAVLSQLPLDVVVSSMKATGRGLVLGGSLNGTADEPPNGEPDGQLLGVDARGALRVTWEVTPYEHVGAVESSKGLVFAGEGNRLLAYDPE